MNDWLEKYRGYIVIVLACLILVGGALILVKRPPPEPILIATAVIPSPTPLPTLTPTLAQLRVYVSGAVRTPDVYLLPPGSIVKDAIQAAGGPAEDADLDRINLALAVCDQQQIYVPYAGEAMPAAPLTGNPSPPPAGGGKVNLNTATIKQLDTLPGIGPVIARRILDYREANGSFSAPEEVMNVKGIGQATYDKLKGLITAP